MDADYPAAHSMDTHWFAVDKDGHVGLFSTGEVGHYPKRATTEHKMPLSQLVTALSGATPTGGSEEEDDDEWDRDFEEELRRHGFFSYHYLEDYDAPEGLIDRYTRRGKPRRPLHLDALPPKLRKACGQVRFEAVCFGEAKQLQPLDFTPCEIYAEDDQVAYLSGNGKTVKPVPGKKREYELFCQLSAEELRSARKGVRIEGLDDAGAREKKRSPRRGKKKH